MFRSDYPRGIVNCFWLRLFPAFDALAIAPALTVASLSPRRRFPVSLLVFPPRPFPRRFPALLAAVALPRLPGLKALLAPFQQATPLPRPARRLFPSPTRLPFPRTCKILGRAHGR
jgi:hypothetical protein